MAELEELKLLGKVIISGKVVAMTGLHIGGAQGSIEIGGVDNAVIRDADGRPYIPGSSLKGKLRSLLERHEGYLTASSLVYQKKGDKPIRIHICDTPECPVCLLFGRNAGEYQLADDSKKISIVNVTPTRLQVRDAELIPESLGHLKDRLDLEYTEVKFENSLDRFTSAANPRQTERVPRGAEFKFEIVLTILREEDKDLLSKLLTAMRLLEDDCLGGGGSRGYGRVAFREVKVFWRGREQYKTGKFATDPVDAGTVQDLLAAQSAILSKLT